MSKFGRLFSRSLKRYPLPTNAATYGGLYFSADISQQLLNKYILDPAKPPVNVAASTRLASVGGCINAPVLYYWYKYLDSKFVGPTVKNVIIKVGLDQVVMTPILIAIFYTVLGILEGQQDVFGELKAKYMTTFIANQLFWIPASAVNFGFVAPHMRIVYVASVAFLWINILCLIKRASYKEDKGTKIKE